MSNSEDIPPETKTSQENQEQEQLQQPTPNQIHRLDQETIHQIAAGEVVQSPSAALKEMIENCLDAGATKVQVIGDDGGLALLQVSDNGHGIAKEDFPLVCMRYATSKLRTIDDLKSLETFGFRGEALAAISYCAKVKITSRRVDEEDDKNNNNNNNQGKDKQANDDDGIGYTASFLNGKMLEAEPQPCVFGGLVGGNSKTGKKTGTTIQVQDLFYNAPLRRKAYGRTQDEWNRIVDVVSKYALQNPHVGFSCAKQGAVKMDLALPPNSTFKSVVSAVKFGGNQVSSHLRILEDKHLDRLQELQEKQQQQQILLEEKTQQDSSAPGTSIETILNSFKFQGHFSDLAFASTTKKTTLILFVNGRLVESASIRRVVEMAYAPFMIGSARGWWVFISINAKPDTVDVNVHPTKHEVMMLHERTITASIFDSLKKGLNANLTAQTTVTTAPGQSVAANKKLQQQVLVSASNVQQQQLGFAGKPSLSVPNLAPCFVARVNEQRGAMLKFVVPVSKKQETVVNDKNDGVDDEDEVKIVGEKVNKQVVLEDDNALENNNHGDDDDVKIRDNAKVDLFGSRTMKMMQENQEQKLPLRREREEEAEEEEEEDKNSDRKSHNHSCGCGANHDRNEEDEDQKQVIFSLDNVFSDLFGGNNKKNEDDDDDEDDDDQEMRNFRLFQKEKHQEEEEEEEQTNDEQNQENTKTGNNSNNNNKSPDDQLPIPECDPDDDEELESVLNIRTYFEKSASRHYKELIRRSALVGAIDAQRALIQCDTSLLLLDVPGVIFYLAEQRIFLWSCWSRLPRWELEEPLHLQSSICDTLKLPAFKKILGLASVQGVANRICQKLIDWSDMLEEYFGILIAILKEKDEDNENSETETTTTPSIEQYHVIGFPAVFGQGLEIFIDLLGPCLLRIATEVNFEDEEMCFRGIAKEISFLYSGSAARVSEPQVLLRETVIPALRGNLVTPGMRKASKNGQTNNNSNINTSFFAPDEMEKKFVVQPLVSTEQLYRVFERC